MYSLKGTIAYAWATIGSLTASARVWAQTSPMPAVPPDAMTPATPVSGGSGASVVAAIVVVVGLLVVIGVAVKLFDLKRKRESEAVQLQAQLSDALLREPALAGLPLTPTAHVPIWSGTPATVELTGQVPSPALKEVSLSLIREEAARVRPDVRIEDRVAVVPSMPRAA